MSKMETLGALFGVFVRATVLSGVGYGVYSLASDAVFMEPGTAYVVLGVALALTVATSLVFLYAKNRNPGLLSAAESVQESVDGPADE